MSHTIENFTQVTLILKDNPEDDGYWRTCWDLSDNGYAMDELLKSGNLKSGETVPLSDGLLRSMLVKAQKDARGFQNTLLGECSHGSEAERKRQAYGFAEILNHALCCCGTFLWWDIQGKAKRARMEAENSCVQQVGSMTESYNKALLDQG